MPCLVADAIVQNTPGYSEGYPAGLPKRYSWYFGAKKMRHDAPPPDFSAVTAWGLVYPKSGAPVPPNAEAKVEITGARTYVRLKASGDWVLVQDQANDAISGGHFVADLTGNRAIPLDVDVKPDGRAAFATPPAGYNSHFWPSERGTFAPGTVDGVYVRMDMRKTNTDLQLVANVGADWWRDVNAEFVEGFRNNPGAGTSNWVTLATHWTTLHFYSVDSAQIKFAPPPPPPLTTTATTGSAHSTDCIAPKGDPVQRSSAR
jgi:hypothetical protein